MELPFTHRATLEGEVKTFQYQETAKAAIDIEFGEVEAGKDYVGAIVRLRLPKYPFVGVNDEGYHEFAFYYGREIHRFVEELESLRTTSQGSARLYDWDSVLVLCLTVTSPGSGKITVGGQLLPALFSSESHSEGNFVSDQPFGSGGGVRVTFDGILTDQSYLISTIMQLRRFLMESEIPNTGG